MKMRTKAVVAVVVVVVVQEVPVWVMGLLGLVALASKLVVWAGTAAGAVVEVVM